MIICGVDPGGATTGIAVRDGHQLKSAELVHRDAPDRAGFMAYCGQVLDAIEAHAGTNLIALEDIHPPKGALGMINLHGVVDTAKLIGMILAQFPGVELVDPGGHGTAPLSAYPKQLVNPAEKVGTGQRRHARAAWDIAGAARASMRLGGNLRAL